MKTVRRLGCFAILFPLTAFMVLVLIEALRGGVPLGH
jgi:hypothetical protein